MIAENKAEFFEQLERELAKLGIEDTNELMADLGEHFAEGERRGLTESEVCRELGSISEIARSCLDLKSSAINSMVAHEVSRKKAVSLTKPGRDVPADPSLAKPREEDVVRSFTPEHIAEEYVPGGSQSVSAGAAGSQNAEGSQSTSAGTAGSQNAEISQSTSAETAGTQNVEGSQNTSAGGTFERLGKKVDAACDKAGKALNNAFEKAGDALDKAGSTVNGALKKTGKSVFSPSDSYRENINNSKRGALPRQIAKVKTEGGGKFIDTSELQPNVNPGRLVGEIILDVLLWLWLVPVVFAGVVALFAGSVALVGVGIGSLLGQVGFGRYELPTRVLFMCGFWALAAGVFCLAITLVKPAVSLVGHIVRRHIRAIYDV